MLIQCSRTQFYDVLVSQAPHVLIVCADDVDALCAGAILQHALVIDHKAFTLRYARNTGDLSAVINDYANQMSHMVLINCGGMVSFDELALAKHHVLFVIDSRRPFDLDNVFDVRRVRILVRPEEMDSLKLPRYEDVIAEEEGEGEEEEEPQDDAMAEGSRQRRDSEHDLFDGSADENDSAADGSPVPKKKAKRRGAGGALMDAVQKREWQKRQADLLWDYYELVFYSTPSSLLMYDLVYRLSLATVDLCWIAIVGATSLFAEGKCNKEEYMSLCAGELRHVARPYDHAATGAPVQIDAVRIAFKNDVWLPMYEHWSLYECVQHCMHAFAELRLWSQDGKHNMLRFFADLGLPLLECKQLYKAMSKTVRHEAVDAFRQGAAEWRLNDIVTGVYVAHFSYSHKFSALECAAAIGALVHFAPPAACDGGELHGDTASCFDTAAGALYKSGVSTLYAGVQSFQSFLAACVREAGVALLQGHIIPTGPFLHMSVNAGGDSHYFAGAHGLQYLGRFVLRAYRKKTAASRRDTAAGLPLVVTAPAASPHDDWHLVCGVVPLEAETMMDKPKTLMPRAFERTANKLSCSMHSETFDNTVVRIRSENRLRFLDCLMLVLHSESAR